MRQVSINAFIFTNKAFNARMWIFRPFLMTSQDCISSIFSPEKGLDGICLIY